MSWLDDLLGTGNAPTPGQLSVGTLTPRQQQWFVSHGVNPAALSNSQLAIAVQTMNNDFATEDAQAKATADAQAKATADAQAKAQADAEAKARAAAEEQARQAAIEEQNRIAAEQEAARIEAEKNKVPPPPPPPAPVTVGPDPIPVTDQGDLTPAQVNQMIADAVTKALETERTSTTTQQTYAQQQAEAAARDAANANTQRLAGLRDATKGGTTSGIQSYFKARGVDPTQYGQSIDDAVAQALGNISPNDDNPSARVDVIGLASRLFSDAEGARRASFTSQLGQMFPETFTNTQVSSNLDDDLISQILGEQRTGANAIVENMIKRGVITPSGATAAYADLDRQAPIAQTRLDQIGTDLIGSERNSIADIISRANKTASTVGLGASFDPMSYKTEVDNSFNDFVKSLGTKFRASAPGNLFTTSGLGAVAGAASGAQNTKFNPNALAGVLEQQTEDASGSPNKNTSSRVTDFVF